MKVKGIDLNRVKTFITTYRPTEEEGKILLDKGFELIKSENGYNAYSKKDNNEMALWLTSNKDEKVYQGKLTFQSDSDVIFTLEMFDEN